MSTSSSVVLIVEDELILRMRAVDIVEDAGFVALEAVDADQAMLLLETRTDIELLLTDIQMPGTMDGIKLAFAVHERWPSIKIILVSGQSRLANSKKPTDSRFIGKPLDVKTMIHALQDMMGKGSLEIVPPQIRDLTPVVSKLISARPGQQDAMQSALTAENDSLRLLLDQASINAEKLLIQVGLQEQERATGDQLQKLIVEELHHRIKNTLATVGAIASQSLRTAESIEHGQRAIEGRLIALGRAHDLLIKSRWASASLSDTISAAIQPFDSDTPGRVTMVGPDISITSGAVIAISMTLNELCTNATKYGALSVASGRIRVSWQKDDIGKRLDLIWSEQHGPTVATPTRRSFGTRLMSSLGQQLRGEVQLNYDVTGFTYRLSAPLAALTSPA
ncbi:response regulator [Bradyrhizobium japonicum]|uniref:sensor histidine kinase n=1 Tax=Bradyrhizobium japonicum TaxID=375 RepID=UPI001BA65D77|nr:HWE histidine kinase domain-containing protein [Bradyrhizobium japonicum]MBR0995498.1 response regulator [Bradyrhizobium japonicum]